MNWGNLYSIISIMKICSKCKSLKETAEFFKHIKRKDGLAPTCKGCMKEYYEVNKLSMANFRIIEKEVNISKGNRLWLDMW